MARTNKRRVLIYAPIIGRGGVRRMVTRLAESWSKLNDWSFVALSQPHDEQGEKIDWPCEFIQIDGGPAPRHPDLFNWLYENQPTFLKHWQRMKGFDLTYLPMPWWTTRVPDFKAPMPIVATLHDFAWDQLNYTAHEFRAEARTFAAINAFACFPSDFQRRWAQDFYGFRSTRTIHHGHFIPSSFVATPAEAARVREHYRLPERYTLAFHCANDKKDPVTILRGQLEARRASPDVPPLVLAGLDTEWFAPPFVPRGHHALGFAQQIVSVIKACGYTYGQDLFVLGRIPETDIAGLYAGATAAITATRNEGGISGAMFEAFAAHTPCIYTDLPIFSERLDVNEYGWVFDVGDVGRLGQLIVDVVNNPDEAFRRAQQAFRFANSRTWDDAAAEYIEVFEEVLS